MTTRARPLHVAACLAWALCGCAGPRYQDPVGKAGYLGLGFCPAEEGLEVVSVSPGSPAARARFQEGDVIARVGELDLSRPESRKAALRLIRDGSGKKLEFRVGRGRKILALKAAPRERSVYAKDALYAALADAVVQGGRVSVAVVPRVAHTRPELFGGAAALAAWQDRMRASLEDAFESLLLNERLLRCGNYGLASRETIERALKELALQPAGDVSRDAARKLGELVGASHLLLLDLTRFERSSGAYEDQTSAKLVAAQTGTVLISARFERSAPPQ